MERSRYWQTNMDRAGRGRFLLESGHWSDCKFLVEGAEGNKKAIPGHRLLLAMASPVFEAMLYGDLAADGPVTISDVDPDVFRDLLAFVYAGSVNLESSDQARELCYAAKKYMLQDLVEDCMKFLWKDLGPENVLQAYEFAKLFDETVMMEVCLGVICEQTSAVLLSPHFEDISLSSVELLVEQDHLAVNSETDIFEAVDRWTTKECGRRNLQVSAESKRFVLGNTFGKIRFLTMTASELSEGPIKSGLLTDHEGLALLLRLVSTQDSLPDGICPTAMPRSRDDLSSREGGGLVKPVGQIDFKLVSTCPSPKRNIFRTIESADSHHCPIMFNKDRRASFTVDRNICILSVTLPTQSVDISALRRQNPGLDVSEYNEDISVTVVVEGEDKSYGYFKGWVKWNCKVEILLDPPLCAEKDKLHIVHIGINRYGWYALKELAKNQPPFYFCKEEGGVHDDGFLQGVCYV